MGMSAIKDQAEELLAQGMGHQQVFEMLVREHPEVKPKRLAEHLCQRPSWQARTELRGLHQLLLALVAISALVRVGNALAERAPQWGQAGMLTTVIPVGTILMGYSLHRWRAPVMRWVGWGNLVSIIPLVSAMLPTMRHGAGIDAQIINSAMAVALGAIALLLYKRAFPSYRVERDARTGTAHYIFRETDPR